MKVKKIHKRTINQPKPEIALLFETLASKEDKIWPKHYWPAIKFAHGLKIDSKGGHGIIRYYVEDYVKAEYVIFKFLKPSGFDSIHTFEIRAIDAQKTEIKHSILMNTKGMATIKWMLIIRWLHDALIENAFDTVENNFSTEKTFTTWSVWVKIWRFIFNKIR